MDSALNDSYYLNWMSFDITFQQFYLEASKYQKVHDAFNGTMYEIGVITGRERFSLGNENYTTDY